MFDLVVEYLVDACDLVAKYLVDQNLVVVYDLVAVYLVDQNLVDMFHLVVEYLVDACDLVVEYLVDQNLVDMFHLVAEYLVDQNLVDMFHLVAKYLVDPPSLECLVWSMELFRCSPVRPKFASELPWQLRPDHWSSSLLSLGGTSPHRLATRRTCRSRCPAGPQRTRGYRRRNPSLCMLGAVT